MTSFVLLNQCSDPELSAALLEQYAIAHAVLLNRDFSTWWGGEYRVRAADPTNPPAPGEVVALILDNLPGEAGALADHGWNGFPTIYAARNMCSSLRTGPFSLPQALGHEFVEVWDLACNRWADDGTGASVAMETADPVEAGFYEINGIAVPDFVTPAWFSPGDPSGRYSFLSAAPAPFTIAPGGYFLRRSAGSDVVQVQGEISASRLAKKLHWSSRSFRRGLRLAA